MCSTVSIEPMRLDHLDEVVQINRQSFLTPWTRDMLRLEMSNTGACYLVAVSDNHVVGFGGEWIGLGVAHIGILAVAPEWRRKKIGEQLLAALLEEAIRQEAHYALLEVRESNHIAQNLYRKYGFHPCGLRPKYYSDTKENAIIMRLNHLHTPVYQQYLQQLRNQLCTPICKES